jgi:uncharacterized protein YjbI with pentapeptide repeats
MKGFFISYNQADKSWAEWIAWQLEEKGYTTVLQAWDFRPGCNFALAMNEAAKDSERTIILLSPEYLVSLFTQSEWTAAFVKDPKGEEGKLLPIRVRECRIEGLLASISFIDFVGLDEEAAKIALINGVERGRAKPAEMPIFPGKDRRSILEKPRYPGAIPEIWNIPHLRNIHFTGREALLIQLRQNLISGKPIALHGLGGVGKTQLALEYAYRYASNYGLVWWIRSEESARLAADYARLSLFLAGTTKSDEDQAKAITSVKHWLNNSRDWLLVFDNAMDPEDVRQYIPQTALGNILITSRNPNWGGIAKSVSLHGLEREESIEFLLKRTGQTDRTAASALADSLGDHPLALEQAAAYMETRKKSIGDYLLLLKDHQADLMNKIKPSTDYHHTIATTLRISFEQVKRECPVAADLLSLCAFLAPEDIPFDLLINGAAQLPESLNKAVNNPLEFDDIIASMVRYSLVDIKGRNLSIHRLVQAVVRDYLDKDKKIWAEMAVRLKSATFSEKQNDTQIWDKPEIYINLAGEDLRGIDFSLKNLIGANLHEANLSNADFHGANLSGANLRGAILVDADLSGANLSWANLNWADLTRASLNTTNLSGASIIGAKLIRGNLRQAMLREANLRDANLKEADLSGSDLFNTHLVETNLEGANLKNCRIYGISAWGVKLEGATQTDLIITRPDERVITVDNLEIAQFLYLLLSTRKIRNVLDAITPKIVLILGRFTPQRKPVLDAIREEIRKHDYLPVLFDFEKPTSRDLTETLSALAHLARFIIADFTDAKSIGVELQSIVPNLPSVPVVPLLLESESEYALFDIYRRYPWVLHPLLYRNQADLIASIEERIIAPAEAKVEEQRMLSTKLYL